MVSLKKQFENVFQNPWLAFAAPWALLGLAAACGQDNPSQVLDQSSGVAASKEICSQFTAPKESHNGLALGLSVVDDSSKTITSPVAIGCEQPLAIFVHGWSTTGDPTEFTHAQLWRQRGFVTMVFRWHDLSSHPSFSKVFAKGSVTAAQRLTKELSALHQSLGNRFTGEIRLIGHSFGAKVAADATARVLPLEGTSDYDRVIGEGASDHHVPVARLTLLDPAVFVDWSESELSLCPRLRIGFGTKDANAENPSSEVQNESGQLLAILSMIPSTTRVEVYSTNVASTFSFSLARKFPVQTLTKKSMFSCYVEFEGLGPTEIHEQVVPGYLSSIAGSAPMLVESSSGSTNESPSMASLNAASVPTKDMVTRPGWHVLRQGHIGKDWQNQIFETRQIPEEYLKIEASRECLAPSEQTEECSFGIRFVKKF
jgi:pimeloyl-ACP methyl ester carboxylesterase